MDISFNPKSYEAVVAGHGPDAYSNRSLRGAMPETRFELGRGGEAFELTGRREAISLHEDYARALVGHERTASDMAERRKVGQQLEAVSIKLAEAEEKLLVIVKHYPPYAPDHPTRIDILNQITGLRKQIEALSIPPQKLSEKDQVLAKQIKFDAPDSIGANDRAIALSLKQIKEAQSALVQLRAGMWADVVEAGTGEAEQAAVAQARSGQEYLARSAKSITLSQDVIAALG